MPNWYEKAKGQQTPTARYKADLSAQITVPTQEDKERELKTATFVLNKFLPESSDASPRTAIDSTVNIDVIGVSPYEQLV